MDFISGKKERRSIKDKRRSEKMKGNREVEKKTPKSKTPKSPEQKKHEKEMRKKQVERGQFGLPGAGRGTTQPSKKQKEKSRKVKHKNKIHEAAQRVNPAHVQTMLSLRKGDKVMVNTRSLSKPRVLTVMGPPEKYTGGDRIYVYVSSGNVRPGHRSGGALIYNPEKVLDNGRVLPEELHYQPTIQQQVQSVTDLKKVSAAQAEKYLMASQKVASQVGKTILEQMGGRRVGVMLGVKKFILLPNGLAFAWPNRQRTKGNYVEITLTPMDEYDMEFFNWAPSKGKKSVKKYRGLHAEDLAPTFERQTGWFLRMASRIADREIAKQAAPLSNEQFQRLEREMAKHAKGEPIKRVELVVPELGVRGGFWVFTTELGMYRIWDKYTSGGRQQNAASKGWSPSNSSWYVKIG